MSQPAGGPDRGPEPDGSSTEPKKAPRKQGFFGFLGEFALIVVIALVISALIRSFLVQLFIIPSASMEQTLEIGDRVVVMKTVSFHRGDVVVFKDPDNWLDSTTTSPGPVRQALEFLGVAPASSTDHLVKRVIGMPGDHVRCCSAQGQVEVNGKALDESSYLYSTNGVQVRPSDITFDVVVPAGNVFVLGDNRSDSRDSRYHLCDAVGADQTPGQGAFVPESDVTGPVVAIAMPFDRMSRFAIPSTFSSIPAAAAAPAKAVINEKPC
ncbi:MAG: signal peptidase I [Propionibacterium sp.]